MDFTGAEKDKSSRHDKRQKRDIGYSLDQMTAEDFTTDQSLFNYSSQIPSPSVQKKPVQKAASPEEEELQMKEAPAQRMTSPEEEELQMKSSPVQKQSSPEEEELQMKKATIQKMAGPEEEELHPDSYREKKAPVQKAAGPEEEELQMKKVPVQKMAAQEEEELQMKQAPLQKMSSPEEEELQLKKNPVQKKSGSGSGMPQDVQMKMESSFGTDFSGVNIHANDDSATQMGALAYTQGNDVHFAPGQYNPQSKSGQELLGHELTHVVQQRQGRVQATTQQKGVGVNDDAGLEKEADDLGRMAAEGKRVSSTTQSTSPKNNYIQKKEGADHLKVEKGQLTFDAEGNDDSKSIYYSRRAHWPGGNSGVTIGRGYDLGHRGSKKTITDELKQAGIDHSKFESAIGLKAEAAEDWLKSNKNNLPEISLDQQKSLFNLSYQDIEKDVKRISTKEDVVEKYGEVNFENLHPAIRDVIVDLRFRGDYTGKSRKLVQDPMVKNDLKGLYNVISDKSNWKNVPEDRFKRRVQYLEAALGIKNKAKGTAAVPEHGSTGGTTGSSHKVQRGETLEILAAKFSTDVSQLKNLNRDKLKQWPTKSGGVIEGFDAGKTITIPQKIGTKTAAVSKQMNKVSDAPSQEKSILDESMEVLENAMEYAANSWDSLTSTVSGWFGSSSDSTPTTAKSGSTEKTATAPATKPVTTPAAKAPEAEPAKTDAAPTVYANQRDNEYSGTNIYGSAAKGGLVHGDNMCNVTSLAMALKSFASDHDLKTSTVNLLINGGGYAEEKRSDLMKSDLEDLILKRFIQLGPEHFKQKVMGATFKFDSYPPHQFGACLAHVGQQITSSIKKSQTFSNIKTKESFKANVLPELEKGGSGFGGTSITASGHVVHLVNVLDDGLLINDPYGLVLAAKSDYIKNDHTISANTKKIKDNMATIEKRLKYNSKLLTYIKGLENKTEGKLSGNMGENVFFSWSDLNTFNIFKWLVILKK